MYLSPFLLLVVSAAAPAQSDRSLELARTQMVEKEVKAAGVKDPRVIRAMLATPRHEFLEPRFRSQAYLDISLPIGCQQTISSPFIVGYMTQCLDPQPTDKVLEIGTGSGYQAAVLRHLVKEVYSIEIHEQLGKTAAQAFKRLGYDNVFTKIGDGYLGWPEHAPFDKIIVTCSPEKPPQPLVEQLREGGRMVIPVGERYQQMLYLFRKQKGQLEAEPMQPTFFVPMTGVAEQQRAIQPDPLDPRIRNGDFKSPPGEDGDVSGWFYQRQGTWQTGKDAPQGKHYVSFRNREAGGALTCSRLRDRRAAHFRGRDFGAGPLQPSSTHRTPGGVPRRGDQFLRRDPQGHRRELGGTVSGHVWLEAGRTAVPCASRYSGSHHPDRLVRSHG